MYDRLEAAGCVVRFDETIRPTMFHAATISQPELEALRSIKTNHSYGARISIGS